MVSNSAHLSFVVLSDKLNMFKVQTFLHFISVIIMQLHHFSIDLPTSKPSPYTIQEKGLVRPSGKLELKEREEEPGRSEWLGS